MVEGLPAWVTEIAAMNIAPSIRERVETNGENSEGGSFGSYSTTPGYFPVKTPGMKALKRPYGKKNSAGNQFSVFQSGEKEGQPHKTKYIETGYDGYKRELDRNIGTKNFSLTGNMWKRFGVSNRPAVLEDKVIVELGGTSEYSKNLISVNSDREKINIIGLNKTEVGLFVKQLQDYVNTSMI
jgi:hypothetical protein